MVKRGNVSCFVLFVPTLLVYRVPRVSPGVCYEMLLAAACVDESDHAVVYVPTMRETAQFIPNRSAGANETSRGIFGRRTVHADNQLRT